MTRGFARLDRAGNLNGARKQQELFCERGFTRVRVRNNGKGTSALNFFREAHARAPKQKGAFYLKNAGSLADYIHDKRA